MADFVYTGQENLEAMKEATNYNRYLTSLVKKQIVTIGKDQVAVLDFGAGIGTYADMLLEDGYKVDCLELDKDQVALLRSKGYEVYADLGRIKKKYDIIYALNVFEHIEDDMGVFKSLTEHLAPGGVAVIYVPALQVLFTSMDRLVGHHRRYDLKRLKRLAGAAGLRVEYLGYGEPVGYFAALAYKLVGNNNGTITPRSVKLYDRYAFPVSERLSGLFKRWFGKNALLVAKKAPNS